MHVKRGTEAGDYGTGTVTVTSSFEVGLPASLQTAVYCSCVAVALVAMDALDALDALVATVAVWRCWVADG